MANIAAHREVVEKHPLRLRGEDGGVGVFVRNGELDGHGEAPNSGAGQVIQNWGCRTVLPTTRKPEQSCASLKGGNEEKGLRVQSKPSIKREIRLNFPIFTLITFFIFCIKSLFMRCVVYI